jgi:hypothetical protein
MTSSERFLHAAVLALALLACDAKPEPAKSEPTKPEPTKPEPAKPEPTTPEPAKPEPSDASVLVSPTGCKLSGEASEQPCADLCKRIEDGALAGTAEVRVEAVQAPSQAQLTDVFDCLRRAGIRKLAITAEAP